METVDIGELVRQTLIVLTLIIVAAKLGGELMGRLGQPPVWANCSWALCSAIWAFSASPCWIR